MTEASHIELAQRLLRAFETADERSVDELVHPAHRDHAPASGPTSGPDGVRGTMRWVAATFGDRRFVFEDLIAAGDRVVARVRFSATHIGELEGVAPTGRQIESDQVHIWRVAEGRLAEHWMVRDDLATMRQIGAVPVAA